MVVLTVQNWWDRFGDTTKKDKINEIINKMLQRDPDYDSGWFGLGTYSGVNKNHSLGTDQCMVEFQGKDAQTDGINNTHIGRTGTTSRGPNWRNLTSTYIYVWRPGSDIQWDQLRVRLWKLE